MQGATWGSTRPLQCLAMAPQKHSRRVERTLLHRGAKFDIEVISAPGRDGRPIARPIVRHPGSVVILPLLGNPHERRVVFIACWRITTESRLIELPAGTREKGEEPLACAARELEEETGYRSGNLKGLGTLLTAPGLTDELMHAFVATDLTHGGQRLEVDEEIEVLPTPAAEALAMATDGRILDAKTRLVLLWAARLGMLGQGTGEGHCRTSR